MEKRELPRQTTRKSLLLPILAILIFLGMGTQLAWFSVARAGVGNGVLYVYEDSARTDLAPLTEAYAYLVVYGDTYYFTIAGITEYAVGQTVGIWACYQGIEDHVDDCTVGSDGTVEYEWTIPVLPYETTIKFKYGTSNPGWYYAQRETHGVGLLHVIPQIPFGILGVISAPAAAYILKKLHRKKRSIS